MQLTVDVDRICVAATLPFCAAMRVLCSFRDRFICEVAPKGIVHELEHKNIIPSGLLTKVMMETDVALQNSILYERLETTSTWESLMTVCDVIIAVPGNPRMKKFGEDMKRMLEGEWCARSHMHTACMCLVCSCTAQPTSVSSLQSALCDYLACK